MSAFHDPDTALATIERDIEMAQARAARAVRARQEIGQVRGTASSRLTIDRIGGNDGAHFAPLDTAFSQRSLPPDRLNFDRTSYTIDTNHPLVVQQDLVIESSDIASWFGQPGGGVQFRFINAAGEEVPTWVLIDAEVLI